MVEVQNQPEIIGASGIYPQISREQWLLNWPGQVVIAGSQVYWTREVTEAITNGGPTGLSDDGDKCSGQLTNIVSVVRGAVAYSSAPPYRRW